MSAGAATMEYQANRLAPILCCICFVLKLDLQHCTSLLRFTIRGPAHACELGERFKIARASIVVLAVAAQQYRSGSCFSELIEPTASVCAWCT